VHLQECDVRAGIGPNKGGRVGRLLAIERDADLTCVRDDVIVGQDLAARGEDHSAGLVGLGNATEWSRGAAGSRRLDPDDRGQHARQNSPHVVHTSEDAHVR